MRYRCQVFEEDGRLASDNLIEEGSDRYREDDVHILARVGLRTLQYNFTNGTKVILGPLEYECGWCDQYGHETKDCPHIAETDDPFDERDYDEQGG